MTQDSPELAPSPGPAPARARGGGSGSMPDTASDTASHMASHMASHTASDTGNTSGSGSGAVSEAVTGAGYGMLFLLGLVLGVVGGFQHSWYVGEVPAAALGWLVVLFVVPYGMGALMGGKLGASVPAAGWLVSSFLLATKQPAGDLAIAGDASGFWYLYGGALAATVAVLVTRSTGSWLLRS